VTLQPIPRVVFDTNVVLSAVLFRHGRLSWLVNHWREGNCAPLISNATAAELTRILAYSRFQLSADEQLEALGGYIPFCEAVEIVKPCPILCRDAKDQPFLDLAYSSKANLLVSGDDDLLALTGLASFIIESPESYRRRVAGTETQP
jgi:putative PIN family toxin of toxin-antitoxin system